MTRRAVSAKALSTPASRGFGRYLGGCRGAGRTLLTDGGAIIARAFSRAFLPALRARTRAGADAPEVRALSVRARYRAAIGEDDISPAFLNTRMTLRTPRKISPPSGFRARERYRDAGCSTSRRLLVVEPGSITLIADESEKHFEGIFAC